MPSYSIEPNPKVTYTLRYEDEHVLVIEKPSRIATQPGLGHDRSSLLNGLYFNYGTKLQKLGAKRDYGLLHRLDRETSGVLIVALTSEAYDQLRSDFERRTIKKFYWAIVKRAPTPPSGVVRKPIIEVDAKSDTSTRKVKLARLSRSGKPAITAYRTLAHSDLGALVECRPVTGRLHQVRVHMAALGSTVLGDEFYATAGVADASPRLALHAHRIRFSHPITGATIDAHAPMPRDLKSLMTRLRLVMPTHVPTSELIGDTEPLEKLGSAGSHEDL